MSEGNTNKAVMKKKSKKLKVIGIMSILLISATAVAYSLSGAVKGIVDSGLEKIPVIKDIVGGKPTAEELDQREAEIARYYVESLDPQSAADKLYIVKKEDLELYNTIVKRMNGISTQGTDKILKEIRDLEIRSDFLNDIYEEVEDEKIEKVKEKSKELEGISVRAAADKIMNGSGYSEGEKEKVFLYLNNGMATDILYYLDGGSRSDILYKLSDIDMRRKEELEKLIDKKKVDEAEKDEKAGNLANVHSVGSPEKSAEILGTDKSIDINILARTYMMMPEKVSAEVLVNIEDEIFLERLYDEIEVEENLRNIDQSVLVLINEIKSYLLEYNSKLDKLAKVYQQMESKLAAESIKKLIGNKDELTVLQIREQDGYKISDYTVAIDIMKKMRDKNLKSVFENMESEDVAKITRILSEE